MRGIPFYAGMLAAILTEEMKKREIKFSMVMIYYFNNRTKFLAPCGYILKYMLGDVKVEIY